MLYCLCYSVQFTVNCSVFSDHCSDKPQDCSTRHGVQNWQFPSFDCPGTERVYLAGPATNFNSFMVPQYSNYMLTYTSYNHSDQWQPSPQFYKYRAKQLRPSTNHPNNKKQQHFSHYRPILTCKPLTLSLTTTDKKILATLYHSQPPLSFLNHLQHPPQPTLTYINLGKPSSNTFNLTEAITLNYPQPFSTILNHSQPPLTYLNHAPPTTLNHPKQQPPLTSLCQQIFPQPLFTPLSHSRPSALKKPNLSLPQPSTSSSSTLLNLQPASDPPIHPHPPSNTKLVPINYTPISFPTEFWTAI